MRTTVGKILIVVDATQDHDHAVTKAAILARHCGAALELFVCGYSRTLVASYLFDNRARLHAEHGYLHGQEKRLEALAQRLVPGGVTTASDVQWNHDLEASILQKIERYRPDLVVKACPYHHRLDQHLVGSLDERLIRHCPAPLLLVKPTPWGEPPTLVAAVDPLHDHQKPASMDAAIVRQALRFREILDGRLSLFHSYQPLPASVIFDDTLVLDYEAFKEKLRRRHGEAMERLVGDLGLDPAIPRRLAQGEAYQVLPPYLAECGADLVVMGAVPRHGLDRLFLGGTAEHSLDHIDCDLLVVKDASFRAPAAVP